MRSSGNYFYRCFTSLLLSYVLLWSVPLAVTASASRERKGSSSTSRSPSVLMPHQNPERYRSGELLIRFRAGLSEHEKAVVIASQSAQPKKKLRGEFSGIEKLNLGPNQNPEVAALQLRLNPAVEFAEPNFLINKDEIRSGSNALPEQTNARSLLDLKGFIPKLPSNNSGLAATPQVQGIQPNDPRFEEQWALSNTGQTGGQFGSDVGVTGAWQQTTGAASTVIAVIDSGIDFTHRSGQQPVAQPKRTSQWDR